MSTARATPFAFADIGWGFYLIFSCLMIVSVPYIYFLLPETKGVPLDSMDELFAERPVRNAGPRLHAKLRVRHEEDMRRIQETTESKRDNATDSEGDIDTKSAGNRVAVDNIA